MKRALTIASCAFFLLQCENVTFDPPSLVNTLRVLAVRADKPFAEPGESVHLEALVADPKGAGRAIAFAWGTCVNPGSAEVTACAAAISSFQTNSSSSFDLTVPQDALDAAPPDAPIGSVGVVFAACAGTIVQRATTTAPVTCLDASGHAVGRDGFMWGEKRVTVVRGIRNQNPTIVRVRIDGALWAEGDVPTLSACDVVKVDDCPATGQHQLQMDVTPDSVETYFGQTEDVVGFFFVSQGSVKDDFLRPDDTFAMPTVVALNKPDFTAPVQLWFVVRDDRGGMDFTMREATLSR